MIIIQINSDSQDFRKKKIPIFKLKEGKNQSHGQFHSLLLKT